MRDFFDDCQKVEPKDETQKENDDFTNSDELRKIVGIEVKKAMDLFASEFENTRKQSEEEKETEKETDKETENKEE